MELFIGSFVIFLLSAVALMLGQFFGREPIGGGCGSKAQCAKSDQCSLKCVFRRRHQDRHQDRHENRNGEGR